jgi:hypothetical protein
MPMILVATKDGLHTYDDGGRPGEVHHAGRSVTALGRARSEFWAILDASEVWHAVAGTWSDVADIDGLRATCITGIGPEVFVGSSQARLFRLTGDSLAPVEGFDRAEGREKWYTPWGGPPDTRSIANWDFDIYVNVHVGGIVRTDDIGATWTPTFDIDADVDHVTTTVVQVFAACAGGLAVSGDKGASWTYRTEGLEARYARAVAVCGDVLLLSTSNGPRGGGATVSRAPLAGGAFEHCKTGLPEWFNDNIDTYCLDALPEEGSFAAFGTSDGRVFGSKDQGSSWDELATGLPPVQRVLVMP